MKQKDIEKLIELERENADLKLCLSELVSESTVMLFHARENAALVPGNLDAAIGQAKELLRDKPEERGERVKCDCRYIHSKDCPVVKQMIEDWMKEIT